MKSEYVKSMENTVFYKSFVQSLKGDSSNLKKGDQVSQQIEKLSSGLNFISTELQSKICEQHNALLTQASHSGQLDNILEAVKSHASSIKLSASEINLRITDLNTKLELLTKTLKNLHITSQILQMVSWFLQNFRELQLLTDSTNQAQILAELEFISEDINLSRVDIVKHQCSAVIKIRQDVLDGAAGELQKGLNTFNIQQIRSSLQIFSNLNFLNTALNTLLTNLFTDIEQMVNLALNAGANLMMPPTHKNSKETEFLETPAINHDYKVKLWTEVDQLFCEGLHRPCKQVQLLDKIINDENLLSNKRNLMATLWEKLHLVLKSGFKNASSNAWHNLELELPRLVGAAGTLEEKLGKKYMFNSELFQPFESGYVNRCQNNLHACFHNIVVPNYDVIDTLIRTSTAELSAAIVNKNLSSKILLLVNEENAYFWDLVEAAIKKTPEAAQIVDSPNALQLSNIFLANVTFYHMEQMRNMHCNLGSNLPEEEGDTFLADLSRGDILISNIIEPLKKSIENCIYAILISLHQDPSLNNNSVNSTGPSLYMKELQQFIARVKKLHLNPYNDLNTVSKCCNELAIRCIDQFIFNVCCVRPLTTMGRKKLVSDCSHLEMALKPFVNGLGQLGTPYKCLRSLSVALDLPPQSVTLDGTLRASTVLMLLFSHAGTELNSPHVALGWNIEKFSSWWESHTLEKDRLEMILGALQKYETTIRQKKNAYYDPVYSIISRLIKSVMQ